MRDCLAEVRRGTARTRMRTEWGRFALRKASREPAESHRTARSTLATAVRARLAEHNGPSAALCTAPLAPRAGSALCWEQSRE